MAGKVFFLGAGFSIALVEKCVTNNVTYPTLQELTEAILDDLDKTPLQSHLNTISPNYKNNIELLLTYLSVDLPWQNPQTTRIDKALYFELTSKINKHFIDLEKKCEYDFNCFKNLSRFMIEHKTPVITLNYDTLLERFLFSYMPEEYQRTNTYKEFYKQAIIDLRSRIPHRSSGFAKGYRGETEDLPDIFKLHGSINWLWSSKNPSNPIYYATGKEPLSTIKDLSEYIIPPILDITKFYNHTVLKNIWSDAYKALRDADEIYIIGFSFPNSDLSIKYLFNAAFSDRKSYPKIYAINTKEAIDPNNKSRYIKERYNEAFWDWNVDYTYCSDNSLEKFIQEVLVPQMNNRW